MTRPLPTLTILALVLALSPTNTWAQAAQTVPATTAATAPAPPQAVKPAAPSPSQRPAATSYRLETDISMRSIPVDVRFSGARVVIFGSASQMGPPPVNAGPLDVVAIIQGSPSHLTVRRKSSHWGIWLNTRSAEFEQAPRFYAVVSTRPLEAVAKTSVLSEYGIGFEHVPISTTLTQAIGLGPIQLNEFRDAAIQLGIRNKQYVRLDSGLAFVGKSLFRGQIDLPATVPVGQLDVSVFLFRGGEVVARHENRVTVSRQGFENYIYEFAHRHALLYGLLTVALATVVGLTASFLVQLRRGG